MTVILNEDKCRTCHKFISNQTAAMLEGLCHDCFNKRLLHDAVANAIAQSA